MDIVKYSNCINKIDSVVGSPTEEDLSLISKFTLSCPKPEDIFVYSVILCDNDIDRDGECFDVDALEELKDKFVGVTGICDHSCKTDNQNSRIYKTEILVDGEKTTLTGQAYTYLKAYCYTVRTKKNEDFIKEIECGIKKEVSVNVSVKKMECSVCGESFCDCAHEKGKTYSSKLCYAILKEPTDAYEYSFVAVPAQRKAGVTKKTGNDVDIENCVTQNLNEEKDEINLKKKNIELQKRLDTLEKQLDKRQGEIKEKRIELKKMLGVFFSDIPCDKISSVVDEISDKTVESFASAVKSQMVNCSMFSSQTTTKKDDDIVGYIM